MKRIFEIIRPHTNRLVLAGFSSLIVSAMNGSLAWFSGPAFDSVIGGGMKEDLWLYSSGVFVLFLVMGVFKYSQNYLMKSVGAKIVRDQRNTLFRHMLSLPLSHYGQDSSGKMLSRVVNDSGLLQELLAKNVRDLFVSSGTIVFLAAVAIARRWDLALIAFVIMPMAFYMVSRLSRKLRSISLRAQKQIAFLTESISEGLSGIKVVKSFSREGRESESFINRNQDYYRELMRAARISEGSILIMDIAAGLGIGAIFYYGGTLIVNGVITAGDFLSFVVAVLMTYTPARRLVLVYNNFQTVLAVIERMDAIRAEPLEQQGTLAPGALSDSIDFSGVSFVYPSKDNYALRDINISIKRGSVVALVGKSGAGKTTFVDLLAGFYRPTSGAVLIDGVDTREMTLKALRGQTGIVSQEVILFNDTVSANIAYGKPDATEAEVVEASKAAFAHEFITALPDGYQTTIGERGIKLSGGERQRISIARAVLKNPPILILDEATSSLDTQSEMLVQKALENLMENRTTIIVAHRLSTVRNADRIVVLDEGKVVEEGTHGELLETGGHYKRFYSLQMIQD